MRMLSTMPLATAAAWLILASAACTPFAKMGEPPIADAGDDFSTSGSPATITLDATDSRDPDGSIVRYEWRYTGQAPSFPDPNAPNPDELDPVDLITAPLPEFCAEPDESEHEVVLPARYCLLAEDDFDLESGGDATLELDLDPGSYRFTVWVTDDDGNVSADSIEIFVEP